MSIAAVLGALFALGIAETFADVGSSSLLPRLVPREDLGIANARLQSAFLLTNQLLMPPVGAFLFAIGMALPFATNAACFALGALLVSRIVLRPSDRPGRSRAGAEAVEHPVGHGRRPPLAPRPPADADARAHDLPVQRHVRGGVVRARPVRGATGSA